MLMLAEKNYERKRHTTRPALATVFYPSGPNRESRLFCINDVYTAIINRKLNVARFYYIYLSHSPKKKRDATWDAWVDRRLLTERSTHNSRIALGMRINSARHVNIWAKQDNACSFRANVPVDTWLIRKVYNIIKQLMWQTRFYC